MITFILIFSSSVAAKAFLSVREMKRILSSASEAFEISSLKKIWKDENINYAFFVSDISVLFLDKIIPRFFYSYNI